MPTAASCSPTGTQAAVRYLNLVGDRYLELVDGPGSTRLLPPGSQIPVDRTQPGAGPRSAARRAQTGHPGPESARRQRALGVAACRSSRARAARWSRCCRKTSSFTNTLADNNPVDRATDRQSQHGRWPRSPKTATSSPAADRPPPAAHHRAVGRPRSDRCRDRRAEQRHRLRSPTCSTDARPPLAGTVDQLNRLAPTARVRKGLASTPRCRRRRRTTANSSGSARTAASSTTTSAGSDCPGHRSAGPDRGVPVDQARRREVRRTLMLKYRGATPHPSGIHRRRPGACSSSRWDLRPSG